MLEKTVIPAIMAKDQKQLDERIEKVADFSGLIQLDVIDGVFAPNHSTDFDFTLPEIKSTFEAHLMVENPVDWIRAHLSKVDAVLAPIEAVKDPQATIDLVKNAGKKIGFVLNPETELDSVREYIDELDQVLFLTVNPGFYGSEFMPGVLEKVRELRKLKPDFNIEVDGGINDNTISSAAEAGANMFVSGSYIIKAGSPRQAFNLLMEKTG